MKHLNPLLLAAAADGQPLAPAQRAHLAACPQCTAELAELRLVMDGLAEAPTPPKDLHQRTLQRIGLAPRTQRGWALRWNWIGAAALGAVALSLFLPTYPPQDGVSLPAPCLPFAGKATASRPAAVPAAKPAAEPGQASASAAPPVEQSLATAPVEEAAALGQVPATQPLDQVQPQEGPPSAKATPTAVADGLKVVAVRGNLLRPGMGEQLQVELQLGQPGLFVAQVVDSRGRMVALLQRGPAGPGPLQLSWDAQDAPSGAYSLKLAFAGQNEIVKILVIR